MKEVVNPWVQPPRRARPAWWRLVIAAGLAAVGLWVIGCALHESLIWWPNLLMTVAAIVVHEYGVARGGR